MSKIDSLLSLADSLSTRSDKLVNSICESNSLISLILELNGSIASADSQIDTMTELINKNNICLNEFEKLYEKSFFLESNLLFNQSYTNETSLDNLSREYHHLLSSFGHQNVCHLVQREVRPPAENKALKNMLLISNLELKPIRCRSTKVSKQKSRYRLSAAYTLNPLTGAPARDFLKSSQETVSTLMEVCERSERADSLVTSLENSMEHIEQRDRKPERAGMNSETTEQRSQDLPEKLFIFRAMSPVNLSTVNLDDLEEYDFSLSDNSPISSEDMDNFHKYLRQSRVDLRSAFPAPLIKSTLHDSVFSVHIPEQKPQPVKFHNPALMLSHAKEAVNQPTAEHIYSSSVKSGPVILSATAAINILPVSNFREHSQKLLSVLQEIPESPTKSKPITPRRKSNFTLFNLLNSPMGSPSGFSIVKEEPSAGRRGSMDMVGKSLTSGLMSLVGNKPADPERRNSVQGPPRQRKKGIRDPIEYRAEAQHKRMPVKLNGCHSSLTILGKQKVINHGDASIFKRPTVRRMSQRLLHEALTESLLS